MPTIDDFIEDDELSSDSSFDSEYSNEQYNSESSEEELWDDSRKKRGKKLSSTISKARKAKAQKRNDYEGITDSEESSSGSDENHKLVLDTVPFVLVKSNKIDSILDFRNEQYLVKWLGTSPSECVWMTYQQLEQFRDKAILKKAQNTVEKLRNMQEDELEEYRVQLEQNKEAERIVAIQPSDKGNWYLIKWRALQYKECTWELDSTLFPKYQMLVDDFLTYSMMQRPLFRKPKSFIKAKKELFTLKEACLREYQLEGVNWLLFSWFQSRNVILADEMGLGKTIQSVCFLKALYQMYNFCGPSMVVVPLSTMDAWQREFTRWAPELNVLAYSGDAYSRRIIRNYEFTAGFDVLLITYELCLKDKDMLASINYKQLMVDEGHRLKNSESHLFEALNQLIPANHRVLITGTPLQNSLRELWSLLHFLDSANFPDYQVFALNYAPPAAPNTETPSEAESRTTRLHAFLKPHLLRRLKKDVEQSLPAKREQILRVELATEQKELYKLVLAKEYCELQRLTKSSLINILGELRKICNHPTIFTGQPVTDCDALLKGSSKLTLLDMLMRRLLNDGHRVLIFSQSVKMLDLLETYLNYQSWSLQRIDGSVTGDCRRRAIDSFNSPGSNDKVFLLSTRAGGLGINLETADTVIIYDSDWNPQNDLQAMARAHRIGQTRTVNIYRLVTSGTVEETVLESAKQKMVLDHLIIQRMNPKHISTVFNDDLQSILKFGAKSLFSADVSKQAAKLDLDAILSRAQSNEQSEESGDFLGQFRVADCGQLPSWEEIIPKEHRLQAEVAEAERELVRKEGPLQEALLTCGTVRSARKRATTVTLGQVNSGEQASLKSMCLNALKTGVIPDELWAQLRDKSDTEDIVPGVRKQLLLKRKEIMDFLHTLNLSDSYRLTCSVKRPSWTLPWTPKDDAMLLVGVHRNGFVWDVIRDVGKCNYSLEQGSVPQSAHLMRRIEYLHALLMIQPKVIVRPKRTKPEGKQEKLSIKEKNREEVNWKAIKPLLRPVKKELEFLKSLGADQIDTDQICSNVRTIGTHIQLLQYPDKLQLWEAVANFWPVTISSTELSELYGKISTGKK